MPKRILIVDDEVDITDSLKAGLTSQGFSVDAYNDPMAALAHFKSKQYDFVILDIRMPKMNGFDLYREMVKLDWKTNYCFFTAFDIHPSEFEKVFPDVNVRAFLKKPLSPSQMVERLNLVLTEHAT
jgi:DNA-binding response OmpR family regulator